MGRSTKDAWLSGPGDLKEADVEDVPVVGQSVRVRGLPAAYSNEAQSEAREVRVVGTDTIATLNQGKMEILQWVHGVIDPVFTQQEAEQVAQKYGPAFRKVIDKIDELSAVDKEAISEANNRFQVGGESPDGSDLGHGNGTGDSGPDLPARTGAGVGDAGGGDV
jgi:hypothetical protein